MKHKEFLEDVSFDEGRRGHLGEHRACLNTETLGNALHTQ